MNARPEPAHPHSRNEKARNLSQPKTGPGRTVIQRRIATRLALRGEELVKSEDAYQRSKNDPDRGLGIKPLLSIAIKDSDSRLHVHLVPDHLIRQMTGWNIKKREGGYEYSADLNCSMILDAEDRALLDTYAPRWKDQRAYPDKIVWNGRTGEEVEMLRQEQLALRREGYARSLEGKLEKYVSKESTITETYVFAGPRARKKKGETASGYRRFIDKDKALPVVADVTITANIMAANPREYESLYRVKCVYAKGKYLAKKDQVKDAIEEFDGTVILVSHDRELLRSLTTRVWVLHNTHIVDFAGSFSEWEQVSEARAQAAAVNASEEESLRRMHEKQKIRRTEKQKEGSKKSQRDARTRAVDAEQTVLSLEAEIAKISDALADPELYLTRDGAIKSANLGRDLERLKRQLDKALEVWAEATEG